jgi:hypothetical protein
LLIASNDAFPVALSRLEDIRGAVAVEVAHADHAVGRVRAAEILSAGKGTVAHSSKPHIAARIVPEQESSAPSAWKSPTPTTE